MTNLLVSKATIYGLIPVERIVRDSTEGLTRAIPGGEPQCIRAGPHEIAGVLRMQTSGEPARRACSGRNQGILVGRTPAERLPQRHAMRPPERHRTTHTKAGGAPPAGHDKPAPRAKSVTHASRLVAQTAPSVASGLGLSLLAAGPALRVYSVGFVVTSVWPTVCCAENPRLV